MTETKLEVRQSDEMVVEDDGLLAFRRLEPPSPSPLLCWQRYPFPINWLKQFQLTDPQDLSSTSKSALATGALPPSEP
ncbi:MAG: hypothetical protein R2880_08485 [Deinococcales bacterium]